MTPNERIARLLAAHGLELARHLRRLVRDEDAAQDLLQDTLVRAHRALSRLGNGANERAWLYRIATNAALNYLRSRSRERRALDRHAVEFTEASTPAWDGEREEQRLTLWNGIAALPERQRVAITLRLADELDYEAIAARLGCTPEAARANVYQATKRLKLEVS